MEQEVISDFYGVSKREREGLGRGKHLAQLNSGF